MRHISKLDGHDNVYLLNDLAKRHHLLLSCLDKDLMLIWCLDLLPDCLVMTQEAYLIFATLAEKRGYVVTSSYIEAGMAAALEIGVLVEAEIDLFFATKQVEKS